VLVTVAELPATRQLPALRTVDLVRRQAEGLVRWQRERGAAAGVDNATLSREREVIAMVTGQHLWEAGGPLPTAVAPRAVMAHRHDWFADAVSAGLAECGVTVVGRVWDGAAAVGFCVAEQPELVLLDAGVARVSLVDRLSALCPDTAVAVQVGDEGEQHALMLAGARAVCHRVVPLCDVAARLTDLLAW
jgi:hypothetical protein